ncbi:hypothetical protein AX16_008291 [Volvariella volvacea WC 439]|nr:hypothetical protein AX16_008291 [Volvariella volvacea WC 439]
MPPAIPSLKQRLAALSLASQPSAPAPPDGNRPDQRLPAPRSSSLSALSQAAPSSPTSPFGKRKTVINVTPWIKRQQNQSQVGGGREYEKVQQVMMKLIFQAGVDFEVIMNASALPDPNEISYDVLLSRILSYLNLYVESDYTVVFFAAGGRHAPAWNWVWKAYRSLSRKYRKNLKRLYIVHSSFFSKMLFSLAGAIISPKFFRKIVYIQTLSELAEHVPLTQIDIPPAVYQENLKYESKIVLPVPQRSSMFGVPLEELMGYDGEKGSVPRVVKDCIQFLREDGLAEEGLFRRSPSSVMLRAAQDAYDRGNVVSLEAFGDPHLAAVLLKKYLRDLPEPVFPEHLYPLIKRCPTPAFSSAPRSDGTASPNANANDILSISYVRDVLLPELAPCVYILLNHILQLMHEISLRSSQNKMDAHNLAIVLCPNLVKGSNPARDVMMCSVPGGPSLFNPSSSAAASGAAAGSASSTPNANGVMSVSRVETSASGSVGGEDGAEGRTTLGAVIKLCIERYYEVFDEVRDRSEAVAFEAGLAVHPESVSRGERAAHQPTQQHDSDREGDDDDDDDDAMLVMPLGPSHSRNGSLLTGGVPVTRGGGHANAGNGASPRSAWKPKPRPPPPPPPPPPRTTKASRGTNGASIPGSIGLSLSPTPISQVLRMRTPDSSSLSSNIGSGSGSGSGSGPGYSTSYTPYSSVGRARSVISIESASAAGGPLRVPGQDNLRGSAGSITIGRGTGANAKRKSVGSGVEAVGVTAEGFFTPPR